MRRPDDRGSTIPLILGFFLIALIVVAGSVSLAQAFVQQRDLQDVCDGAATAAAASAGDLDRTNVAKGNSLQFTDVDREVARYLSRDDSRRNVHVQATLSADHTRVTLACRQTRELAFGKFFDRATVRHTATSTARAAVVV
ncbi:MAG: pilus assembly protein TadG-related protein [Jatrophihabitans sp.]